MLKGKRKDTWDGSLAELLTSVLSGALFILFGGFAAGGAKGLLPASVAAALYVALVLLLRFFINRRRKHMQAGENLAPVMGRIMFDAVVKMKAPVFICDVSERIIWYNTATESLTEGGGKLYGASVSELFGVSLEEIRNDRSENGVQLRCGDRSFTAKCNHIKTDDNDFVLVVTTETTEQTHLQAKLADAELVVAYIYIDNLTEIMQYDSENSRMAAGQIDEVLRAWAEECGAILKEYERDKYLFLLEARVLAFCVKRRFDVLDRVRAIRIGDAALPMTISMGISNIHGSYLEKERTAHAALDMALQRGGDQAVVKGDGSIDFYGGITKTVQKRTNVRSRVVSGELMTAMKQATNVLIMGHRYADFDAFGACIGLARMAMYCGARVNVVLNLNDRNLIGCREWLASDGDFLGVFVDAAMGLDLLESGTLVVAADVNNLAIMESADLANRAETLAIIDHHRKVAEFEREPKIEYIEPSASSASELVTEMLEQVLPKDALSSAEASLLLAGIILDTGNFTKNTGTRTFSAAMFLRDCGGAPDAMLSLNRTSLDDYLREARFRQNVTVYRKVTAITCPSMDGDSAGPADRIMAAKAASNLLSIEGIEASFALVRIGEDIHISARSHGKINVQILLEKLRGGGHFDAAGAQLSGCTLTEALQMLKKAIDETLDGE